MEVKEKALANIASAVVQVANQPANLLDVNDVDTIGGLENLSAKDFKFPSITLVQPTTRDVPDSDMHLGQWYNELTGEFLPEVNFIVANIIGIGRSAFDREFSADSKPYCRSDNGKMPVADYVGNTVIDQKLSIQHTINALGCAQCPLSKFGTDAKGKTVAPLCGEQYSYYIVTSDYMPAILRLSRTGIPAARLINSLTSGMKRSRMIRLTSQRIEDDKGKYYIPVVGKGEPTDNELKAMARKVDVQIQTAKLEAAQQGQGGWQTVNDKGQVVQKITITNPNELEDLPL